jgi:hypothetical protein
MRITLLLICFLYQTLTWAQCSFTHVQDVCEETDGIGALIQLWDGDFIAGGGGAGCDGNPDLAYLTRFNCKGEIVWQKTYPENDAFGSPYYFKQIDSNTIIAASGSVTPRVFKVEARNGNLIDDTYDFIPTQYKRDFFPGGYTISGGYIYTCPNNAYTSYTNYMYVIKMDISNLNIVWMKEIRLNNLTANQDVIIGSIYETANGNLHVLGFVVNESNMFMITIDTSAQIMDFKYIFKSVPPQTEIPGLMKRIRQSPDKTKYFFRLGVQNNSSANYIGVIDTSGTTLKYSSYPNVNTLIQTRDGNYAICGEMDLIRKLDTNFQTMYTIKSPWLGSRYVVIGEADDGGLFVGGTANILPTRGDMAFIKAEPHGGINSVQEVQDLAAQIQTSPNPATTQVHITSPVKIESYTINNTSGTQLQSGVLENDNNIDISQLPQGLYFLQVQLENGQMVTKKLVRCY